MRLTRYDIVEPDLCFVSKSRLGIVKERLIDGAPDLVMEMLSPSTRNDDLVRKMALYSIGGVREYWIIDSEDRSVRVMSLLSGGPSELTVAQDRIPSVVLPELRMTFADVFPADV